MTQQTEVRDGMKISWDAAITMDDGIVLRADVYAPIEDGQYPVILTYGPYAKGVPFQEGYPRQWKLMTQQHPDVEAGSTNKYQNWEAVDPEKWIPHGYVCVRVDSRGAGRSPGYQIGIMHGTEALLPEWPRVLMLLGADCLIWPNQLPGAVATSVARTRAAESRMYVVSAQSNGAGSGVSQIIDPNGMVSASTLQGESQHACGLLTPFGNSRMKEIVPGTHVVNNRHPHSYGRLTR